MIKRQRDEFEERIDLRFNEGTRTINAFLTNFKTRTYVDIQEAEERMALLCYFLDEMGETFKCYYAFNPYFYVGFEEKAQTEVRLYIENKVAKLLKMQTVEKVDLEEMNHLSGRLKKYLKLSFRSIGDLSNARKILEVKKKKTNTGDVDLYLNPRKGQGFSENPKQYIHDIREYDVPYHCRVCIDTGLRAGKWFQIDLNDKFITGLRESQKKSIPDLKVLAYDIETSKDPFKFPEKQKDVVMMISMMYEGQAVLIVNNGICLNKVQEFDYEPEGKPQYRCHVQVINAQSQKATLQAFVDIIQEYRPTVITSFNGDKFDYPFIEVRCEKNFIDFANQMGVSNRSGEYFGSYLSHLDCFYWVERDAYLPQGSRGLKAVTRSKLKYQPIEVNPEEMVEMGKYETQKLAQYSVSDAVATFFLYMKHIHGFIYALATIIPMMPDQVLRKGSGTLCENLLMAEAFSRNIIFPNKQIQNFEKFYRGHLLQSETYTGGKVECLRSGIYRADFKTDFTLSPKAFQDLIDSIDEIIEFTVKHEKDDVIENVQNIEEVRETLRTTLSTLRDIPNPMKYETLPLIYHIDVAAMYPNIIITNRLQPVAVVNDRICSGCLFNSPQNNCKRSLEWEWKGEYFPLNEGEYSVIKEKQAIKAEPGTIYRQNDKNLKNQVRKYCQKVYSKSHISASEVRRDTVCMRENSFYVDTVRAFRDRRYQYKGLVKIHKARAAQKAKQKDFQQEKEEIKMMELFESMQLAHKIILNSFYGYVMRKGSRWYSMETAAMVTYIGSNIINDSKNFVEGRLGKPLQLDTDGIWMLLPQGFPQNIKIKLKNGKSFNMEYPCQILNHLIYEKYANPQYQTLQDQQNFKYDIRKQMTIAFEIDGPYKAMFIPGGKDKKKTTELDIQQHSTQMLKKRYVVFNFKNEVSEFKGLQMKRRGQLNIIKMFQSSIFSQYVKGSSLKQCYQACAEVAMEHFNFLLKRGQGMTIDHILQRLEESKNLSKDVTQYGESKGVAINSAKRLAEYLGPQVVKGKNLCCYYIISAYPAKRPVTERAIPTQIFFADEETQKKYLYSWTKNDAILTNVDIRDILDWDYYKERLSTQIQKMVCIPAVMQNIPNPIPQIQLPDWLQKKTFDMRFHRQSKIFSYGFTSNNPLSGPVQPYQPTTSAKKIVEQIKQQVPPKNIFQLNPKNRQLFSNSTKNPYSMKTNFKSWLGEQKKIWQNNKRQSAYNESMKFQQLKSILHIVPIANSPGSFTIWYYSGNKIQQLLLNYKRHFYTIDNRGQKKAPREEGTACQIVIDEKEFLENQNYYDDILGGAHFYETKMPLLINLIMKKGNLWKISKQLPMYKEDDVQQVFGGQYLANIQDNFMPIVYLSRIQVLENRQIYAIINPRAREYKFVFVDHSSGKNNDQLLRLARKTIKKEDCKIQIKSNSTEYGAGKIVNQTLLNHLKQMKNTFMVVLQSDCTTEYLKSMGVDLLEQQMPVLKINGFKVQGASTLDWRHKSIIKVIEQSLGVTRNVVNSLQWSRFTHIPICNLAENQSKLLDFVTNITYSRLLHSGDYVTWWNDYNSEIISTYESKTQTGRVVNPGLYTSYCIQINVDNIAVNTIANSDQLMVEDRQAAMIMQKNQPGHNRATQGPSKVQSLDEMTQAKRAFEYLKKMVKGWIKDLNVDWDKANELLSNLHKWITLQSNELYDPLLFRMVNELMKKVFSILIKKLNNLGMNIIFANFSKIIVATDKHTYQQARSTISYILKKCMDENQKLFGFMTLNALGEYYQVLLYKDPFNFVGVLVSEQDQEQLNSQLSLKDQNGEEEEEQNKFQYSFQITKLFNPIIKKQFQNLVLMFVNALCDSKKKLVKQYAENKMRLMLNYEKLITERMIQYIRGQFTDEVEQSLRRVQSTWEIEEQRAKINERNTDGESDASISENEGDEQSDSFVVDDYEQQDQQREDSEDILGQIKDETNRNNSKKNSRKKMQKQKKQKVLIDFQKWGKDKQIDILVENLFKILNYEEAYAEQFSELRKKAFQLLHQEHSFIHRFIQPEYPQFQLPCSRCFLVNEQPGLCEHCKEPIDAKKQLQNSVWKMMQQQGRDLYCNRCNRIMDGYLKKCGCGGKWQLRDFPLKWVPYVTRDDQGWQYVNKVFEFMGVD